MDCQEAGLLTARAVSGNASSDDSARLQVHLDGCPACARAHGRAQKVWELMGNLSPVALSEQATRAASALVRQSGAARRRFIYIVSGVAAAGLLAVLIALLSGPRRGSEGGAAAVLSPAPEAPRRIPRDATRDEVEQYRVESILTEVEQDKQRPEAPKPEAPEKTPAPTEATANVPKTATPPPTPAAPAPPVQERRDTAQVPPAPAPLKPEPTPKPSTPEPQERDKALVAATLDRVEGIVYLVSADGRTAARAGSTITTAHAIETVGPGSQAVVEFTDGTRLALGADARVIQFADRRPATAGKAAEGKRVFIAQGVVAAQVVRQPAAELMTFLTTHAEARVLGTRLTLSVTPAQTRVDVREGRVKLVRKEDGNSVDVSADHYAVVAKGVPLTAKPIAGPRIILRESFDGPKWGPAWTQANDTTGGLKLANQNGVLSLRVPQRPGPEVIPGGDKTMPDAAKKALEVAKAAPGSKGEWPRFAWLETRQTFLLGNDPLRIRARLWQSHSDGDRITGISLNRAAPAQSLVLERRGDLLQLVSEGTQTLWRKDLPALQEWETLELWVTRDQVVVRRNDLTLHAGANPLKARIVQVAFGTQARPELAQDEEVRFDDVEIAWTSRVDFEEVSR